jgi:hypothetical protein
MTKTKQETPDIRLARMIAEHDGIVVILYSNGTSMASNQFKTPHTLADFNEHKARIKEAWEGYWNGLELHEMLKPDSGVTWST